MRSELATTAIGTRLSQPPLLSARKVSLRLIKTSHEYNFKFQLAECAVPSKTDGFFKNDGNTTLTTGDLVPYNTFVTVECNSDHDPFAGATISTDLRRACSNNALFNPLFDDITCQQRKWSFILFFHLTFSLSNIQTKIKTLLKLPKNIS